MFAFGLGRVTPAGARLRGTLKTRVGEAGKLALERGLELVYVAFSNRDKTST